MVDLAVVVELHFPYARLLLGVSVEQVDLEAKYDVLVFFEGEEDAVERVAPVGGLVDGVVGDGALGDFCRAERRQGDP